jgi:glutamate synthase (NADPH/NADH) small chain
MGKVGGFLEYNRKIPGYRLKEERLKDFKAVENTLSKEELREQAARCMECGTPFCHASGCPLGNMIPEFNELVYLGLWKEALAVLLSTGGFPEFTGRLCPELCEASCVLGINDDPVTIRQIELAIIETAFDKGYMKPSPPSKRLDRRIAVVGSGPAGLAVGDALNKLGYHVTIFDNAGLPGGILRYGIPGFKLEKWVVDRRINLMKEEGILFENRVTVGEDMSYRYLRDRFHVICLAGGAREPRDLKIPGRDLDGIHFAMDYLTCQNRKNAGEPMDRDIDQQGKRWLSLAGATPVPIVWVRPCVRALPRSISLRSCPSRLLSDPSQRHGRHGRICSVSRAATRKVVTGGGRSALWSVSDKRAVFPN